MYARGLRPFQDVFYITRQIKDLIEWRGSSLCELRDFSKVVKLLSDEEITTYLVLNDKDFINDKLRLPHQVGIESILGMWESSVSNSDTQDYKVSIKRILDNYKILDKNSALEKYLVKENTDIETDIYHTSDVIFVVLDNTKNTNNLLNKTDLIKDITKKVIKTYSLYYTYSDVSKNDWFVTYIDQL